MLFVSAAVPRELEGTDRARDAQALMVSLVIGLSGSGGELVFGGHPTITPLVRRLVEHGQIESERVHLYLPRFFDEAADHERDRAAFVHRHPIGAGHPPNDPRFAEDLAAMRDAMAKRSNAALFVGGQTSVSLGNKPGLRDEWERFRAAHPRGPAFVTALLDGYAAESLIPDLLDGRIHDHAELSTARCGRLCESMDVDEVVSMVLGQLHQLHRQGRLASLPHA